MKHLPHVICALFVISLCSTVGFCERLSLLYVDRKLNLEERKLVAKGMLDVLKEYDSGIPVLSPRESDYVANEWKSIRGDLGSQRAKSFIDGREHIISSIRANLDPAIAYLEVLTTISERYSKHIEIKLWATIVKLVIGGGITHDYDVGKSRGYFKKDLSHENIMMEYWTKQILEQMVIKQLE